MSTVMRELVDFADRYHVTGKWFPRLGLRDFQHFQILIYHRVLPDPEPFGIDVVASREFRQHLEILSSFFRVIPLKQAMEELDEGDLMPGTVCITFDDGYADNFEHAFPVLREYNLPATVFLVTDFIDSRRMLWPDMVLQAMKCTNIRHFSYPEAGLERCDLQDTGRRLETAHRLLHWLKGFSRDDREKRIEEILDICQLDMSFDEKFMLSWEQIKVMYEEGISFGAHGTSHTILSLLNEEEIEDEIRNSKVVIENAIGGSVGEFAYPNGQEGDFDWRCKRILKELGFSCAVTTCRGVNSLCQDRYELARGRPWESGGRQFFTRLIWERFVGQVP